jgi:hypothetical protein|tara:strand:- start:117 stop:914 length:798 start_codon:yes stop_codon:yes gene_type:complete
VNLNKKTSLNILYRLAFIVGSVYIVTATMLFFNKTSYIYFPENVDFYTCSYFTDTEKIQHNGTRMYYKQNGKEIVVLYHGNAGSACDRTLYASYFDAHNISYILVEYAGYAKDNKKPSRELIFRDVDNVVNLLETLNYDKLIILGESIGAGVAAHHTTLKEPDKMILISPFTRLSDIARIHYPFYPTRFILEEEYDNVEPLSRYKGELLIISGKDDRITPYSMSEELYNIAETASYKELMPVLNAEHNDLFIHNEVFEKIIEFII